MNFSPNHSRRCKTPEHIGRPICCPTIISKFWWVLVGWLGCVGVVEAGEPPAEPILRIEAGMHTAPIRGIASDAEGRWLVTASPDKTLRVWDAHTGRLLRVLRLPISSDVDEGKLYTVAITPDGQTVAGAGWTGEEWDKSFSIYLFDRATGLMTRRMKGIRNVVKSLAFSRDGKFLATTLGANWGMQVWRVADGSLVGEDRKDCEAGVSNVAFGPDGRLVIAGGDGSIRLYDSSFRRAVTVQPPGGKKPKGIAWSPDGSKLAVGFGDSTAINILSSLDLSLIFAPDTSSVGAGILDTVAFSSDGQTLFGGSWSPGNSQRTHLGIWSQGGMGRCRDVPVSRAKVWALVPRPGGGVFYASYDPAFGFLDESGLHSSLQTSVTVDMRGQGEDFGVNTDGAVVTFGYEQWGQASVVFSLKQHQLLPIVGNNYPKGLERARLTSRDAMVIGVNSGTLTLQARQNKFKDQPLTLEQDEIIGNMGFSSDGQRFALAGSLSLYLFDSLGKRLWRVPTPLHPWAVNITGDDQLVLAACDDGTIRWYRLKDGQELLAFFPHADRKRWVLWTPEGYYDCSSGGEDLIGWHVNNGKDAAADFFPASRFRETKYRPDVIAKVLDTLDTKEALRLANEEAGRKPAPTPPVGAPAQAAASAEELRRHFPPVITVLAPTDSATFNATEVTVRYSVRTPSDEPVTSVRALVDGRAIEAVRGIRVEGAGATGTKREIRLTLPERDCEVAVIAENRFTASEPSRVRLKWAGRPATAEEMAFKPKLYVLAVGVSKYAKEDLELKFAAKDAKDFTAAMQAQEGGLYQKVTVKLLTDAEANKEAVLDGLEWLEKQTTGKDMGMLFLAGHGETDASGTYYFLPQNANVDRMKSSCVSFADIQATLRNLAGKALFFADTCHSGGMMGRQVSGGARRSGGVDVNRLVNELSSAENGVVVFASSTGRQYSLENATWNNGAFTKALVEGLGGKADVTKKLKITVTSLDFYLAERVKELTDGKQTPVTTKPNTMPDFPIAVVISTEK